MILVSLAVVASGALATPARSPAGAPNEQRAAVAPCTIATTSCTEWIVLGGGPARSLIYRNFPLATRNDAVTRVLVSIHGAGRDADNYFRSSMAAAFLAGAMENTLVISPRMASNAGGGCRDSLATNEISWNCNSWRSGGPAPNNDKVTSFDFLDEILRKVTQKSVFPNLRNIVVVGHSAGGQVVNRYSMSTQIHDKLGVPIQYIVSNPSSYAYPSNDRPTDAAYTITSQAPGYIAAPTPNEPAFRSMGEGRGCTTYDQWPYGFQNRTGYTAPQSDDQLRKQMAARSVTYLLGELDILPLGGFDSSCGAMAQGPTRLARGLAYAKYANEKIGAKHKVVMVSLCGHNARCMYTSETALKVLFPAL